MAHIETNEMKEDQENENESEKKNTNNTVYDKKKYKNIEKKIYARKRFLMYKHLFNNPEEFSDFFIIKFKSFLTHFKGALYGMVDGSMTISGIAVKWGSNGGFICGGLVQLFTAIVTPFIGAFLGFFLGGMSNQQEMSELMKDYRYSIGSTATNSSVKNNTKMFPGYKAPSVLTLGDRQPLKGDYIPDMKTVY